MPNETWDGCSLCAFFVMVNGNDRWTKDLYEGAVDSEKIFSHGVTGERFESLSKGESLSQGSTSYYCMK